MWYNKLVDDIHSTVYQYRGYSINKINIPYKDFAA